jgi:hypothetical protein
MSAEIHWRRYTPADEHAVLALKLEQDKLLGQPMDLGDLTKHPVLIAEVGEIAGSIIGVHTLEAIPEYCMFSRDPRFTEAAIRRAPIVCDVLRENGFRFTKCFVPEWIDRDTETISAALESVSYPIGNEVRHFKPLNGLRHMVLDLRQPEKKES